MTTAENPVFSRNYYLFLFSLLGLVCSIGLFVPLLDNDAAHHANIALRMYLTGDYVNLMDGGTDYLDKPHLHFWLSAFSYQLFGISSFAYKLPSFLFSILGVYSVYRAGKLLYTAETGRLAALIMASSISFLLANSDVRMDAIITATIAFSFWQLAALIKTNAFKHIPLAALGLALGFSTKGMIAVAIPALAALVLLLQLKSWRGLLNYRWLVVAVFFAVFISPVLYCYYLQFNLHPEKMIRGNDQIDGVRFILLHQNLERFSGGMGNTLQHDYLFFFHSFLWSFAPWCLLAFAALYKRFSNIKKGNQEWASVIVFLLVAAIVSFSGFKLPHYLNISFPFAALFTAGYIMLNADNKTWTKHVYLMQRVITLLILAGMVVVNFWSFQVNSYLIMGGLILLLSSYLHFFKSSLLSRLQKTIGLSVTATIVSFFLINSNFYPRLLQYQGGNQLAAAIKGKTDPARIYFWKNSNSASFDFYTGSLRKEFNPQLLKPGEKNWLVYYPKDIMDIQLAGIRLQDTLAVKDYEISRLGFSFLDPQARDTICSVIYIAEIAR